MGQRKIEKEMEEMLESDMIARGLQRLDAHDRERWPLGCKTQANPSVCEHLLGSRNKRKIHTPGSEMMMMNNNYDIFL